MKLRLIASAVILASAISATGVALSHSGATGIVKKRMDVMSDIAKSMKAIGAMMKGEAAFDAEVVKKSATAIADHTAHIPKLFPEGSDKKPSEALPTIWTDWDKFIKLSSEMGERAKALAVAAEGASGPGEIGAQFGAVAKTCKACHADFRLKK